MVEIDTPDHAATIGGRQHVRYFMVMHLHTTPTWLVKAWEACHAPCGAPRGLYATKSVAGRRLAVDARREDCPALAEQQPVAKRLRGKGSP